MKSLAKFLDLSPDISDCSAVTLPGLVLSCLGDTEGSISGVDIGNAGKQRIPRCYSLRECPINIPSTLNANKLVDVFFGMFYQLLPEVPSSFSGCKAEQILHTVLHSPLPPLP